MVAVGPHGFACDVEVRHDVTGCGQCAGRALLRSARTCYGSGILSAGRARPRAKGRWKASVQLRLDDGRRGLQGQIRPFSNTPAIPRGESGKLRCQRARTGSVRGAGKKCTGNAPLRFWSLAAIRRVIRVTLSERRWWAGLDSNQRRRYPADLQSAEERIFNDLWMIAVDRG
jgi:hypothetical protein